MLGHAAAPLVVPWAGITVAIILVAFAWMALYGLKYGYDYSLGALVRKLADMTDDIWIVGGALSNALRSMDYYVAARIGDGLEELERAAARLWDGLNALTMFMADTLADFSADVFQSISGLVDGEIPQQVGGALAPVRDSLSGLRKKVRQIIEAELGRLANGIDGVRKDLLREALARERGIDFVGDQVIAYTDAAVDRVNGLIAAERAWARRILRGELRTWEEITSYAAIGGIALATLTRVFPYWRCTNVRGFNRALCRLPVGMLDDLLAAGITALVLSDICLMARAIREGADLFAPVLSDLVNVAGAATQCAAIGSPPALSLSVTALPTETQALAL